LRRSRCPRRTCKYTHKLYRQRCSSLNIAVCFNPVALKRPSSSCCLSSVFSLNHSPLPNDVLITNVKKRRSWKSDSRPPRKTITQYSWTYTKKIHSKFMWQFTRESIIQCWLSQIADFSIILYCLQCFVYISHKYKAIIFVSI
jgi:hypothetical protein